MGAPITCPKCQHPLSIAQGQRPFTSFTSKSVACPHCAALLHITIHSPQRWWSILPWVGLGALVIIIMVLDRIRTQALAGMPVNPSTLWWFAILIPSVVTMSVWSAIQNYRTTRVTVTLAEHP